MPAPIRLGAPGTFTMAPNAAMASQLRVATAPKTVPLNLKGGVPVPGAPTGAPVAPHEKHPLAGTITGVLLGAASGVGAAAAGLIGLPMGMAAAAGAGAGLVLGGGIDLIRHSASKIPAPAATPVPPPGGATMAGEFGAAYSPLALPSRGKPMVTAGDIGMPGAYGSLRG